MQGMRECNKRTWRGRVTLASSALLIGLVGGCPNGVGDMPTLETISPASALPGERVVLQGQALLTPQDAAEAVAAFDAQDLNLPLTDLTDTAGTLIVPPLAAGTYALRVRYPDGTSTQSLDLTIRGVPPATMTPSQAGARLAANVTAGINDVVSAMQTATSQGEFPADVAVVTQEAAGAVAEFIAQIGDEIAALSPEELAYLEQALGSTDLFDDPATLRSKTLHRARPVATTHALLYSLDAGQFIAGNFSAFCKTSGYVFAVAPGLQKVASVLLKLGEALGIFAEVLTIAPCDLTSLVATPASLTLDAGAQHELVVVGTFEAEGAPGEVAAGITLDSLLAAWKPFAKANPKIVNADTVVREILQSLIGMLGGRVVDAIGILDARAVPCTNVRIDMELYNVPPDRLAESLLGSTLPPGVASALVSLLGLPDWTTAPSVESHKSSVVSVRSSDMNVIIAQSSGTATVRLQGVSFSKREVTGSEDVVEFLRSGLGELLGVVDVGSHGAQVSVTVRSGGGGGQDSDGDGTPDAEDGCPSDPSKTSPGDCGCGVPETLGCGEQPGLVARWTCDGNALDASGNGNHGTASGAVLAADRFGNPNAAYHFDGVDDGVHVPNSSSLNISGNHSISITAWIRAASIPPARGGIVWKWGPGGPEDDQYTLHLRDGGHPSFVLSDVWTTMVQAPAPVTLHAWTHVAGVYDSAAGQMRLYVNGTLADNRSLSYYNIQSTAEPVYIGRGCNLDDFFHGTIDDVRIYDRALSAGEVATLAGQ